LGLIILLETAKGMQSYSAGDNTELYKLSLEELWQLFPIEVVAYNPMLA
jgi:hypothetical protein